MDASLTTRDKARVLAADFAARAAVHDRDASFPFANFQDLANAGLLALTVPRERGGIGAGAREAADVLGTIAYGDSSTALVLAMHYIQHASIARSPKWPSHLAYQLAKEAAESVSLINALRVEPELGSPARGGLPATIAKRTPEGWRITGHKIYSTGSPILKWYLVWARTDEEPARVGSFLVPAGSAGARVVETWDHAGLRASGSHDVYLDNVLVPLDHEIDVRTLDGWRGPDTAQLIVHSVFVAAIYDGVARAARDWLIEFLKTRTPASLGAPLATLARAQEILGEIEVRLAINARLIRSISSDHDSGQTVTSSEANAVKLTVTENAVLITERALSLSGNHGLTRTNPLERYHRDVLCGRVHTPQDDSIRVSAGRAALGI
jgi:alkylation response protein AidB-like acyl-CoA dehydrogenase